MILEKIWVPLTSEKTVMLPEQLQGLTDMLGIEILENILTKLTIVSVNEKQRSFVESTRKAHCSFFFF